MLTAPPDAKIADRAPVNLLALSFYWLPINLFWTVMLTAFLPDRVQQLVGTEEKGTYLGYISAFGGVATTIIQLLVGPLSDASGNAWGRRRPWILWGTILSVPLISAFAVAPSFGLLMLAFFGIQIFLNAANGAYQALLPDNVPATRHGVASAYMGVMLLVGQLLGAVSLIFLQGTIGIVGVLMLNAGLLLLGMAVSIFLVPDRPADVEDRISPKAALMTLRDLGFRRHKDFFGLLYSRFFINLAYFTVVAFLFYYLQDSIGPRIAEVGAKRAAEEAGKNNGFVLLAATLAGLVGTVVVGQISDKMSKKTILFTASGIIGLSALFFAFLGNMTGVLIIAVLFGIGWGAFQAVDWALATNLLPEEGAAKYMAVWHVCMTVPQIIAPAAGLYADPINRAFGTGMGWRAVMLSTVIFLLIGTALLTRVKEKIVATEPEAAA